MSIVNCKVQYIRPKYKNLKDWMDDTNNVYVGRKNIVFIDNKRFPEKDSIFCNPFKITKLITREKSIELYKKYIDDKIKDENFKEKLLELKGKNLGCWCYPENCHAEYLLEILNKL